MLAIEVNFLTGRYIATAYNSRQAGEWPPHPARLFSALVATHFADEEPAAGERAVLEWLEAQPPPEIRASGASAREIYTVFVPVNDVAMTYVDEESEHLDRMRRALEEAVASGNAKAVKKASSAVAKAEKQLKAAIRRAVSVHTKSLNPAYGLRVLPEFRVRQPRTFPSVTPEEPRVTYVWADAQPTPAQRERLDALLSRLVRLGHSSSLVSARIVDDPGEPNWRPSSEGDEILRTTQSGQLAALDAAYALHRERDPRVMPARFEVYTTRSREEPIEIARSVFSRDWLVFRRVGGPSLPMTATAGVARAFRRALLSYADERLPETVSGHAVDGSPSQANHLAVVPLPFVGHAHATGSILGLALVLPRATSEEDRRALYSAIASWEGKVRLDDEDTPRLSVKLGRAGVLELERVEWASVPATLRSQSWCRASRKWVSATPVALDQNPGDLRSRNLSKLAAAIEEATAIVSRACVRIGLPVPIHIDILPAAPLAGAAKARRYPSFPDQPGRTQRVLTHVRLVFETPVRGPVLLGAGRYLGLGLFRPEADA